MSDPTAVLPHSHGVPAAHGVIKLTPMDFIVEEILSFDISGEGEHAFVHVEKAGENTDVVARQLAAFCGVRIRDVSYAGLKDRHGLTSQWFSIQLPGKEDPDWTRFNTPTIRILTAARNARKLRKGALKGNRFSLCLRQLSVPPETLEARLTAIQTFGVPTYFGPQRFGHQGDNTERARQLFKDKERKIDAHRRGLFLSAARSQIFNDLLAQRVMGREWDQWVDGDVFMFEDSKSFFIPDPLDQAIQERLATKVIHPSGVLVGQAPSSATGKARFIEEAIEEQHLDLVEGLRQEGLETQRRPFRLCPEHLRYESIGIDAMKISFTLPAGSYATTVLREVIQMARVDI